MEGILKLVGPENRKQVFHRDDKWIPSNKWIVYERKLRMWKSIFDARFWKTDAPPAQNDFGQKNQRKKGAKFEQIWASVQQMIDFFIWGGGVERLIIWQAKWKWCPNFILYGKVFQITETYK